jgi:hypothetical protein
MRNLRRLLLIGCLVYLSASMAPKAKANEWDQRTVITFSGPVELPGIVLPAGTYVFRVMEYTADGNMVQVLSEDEQKVYATIRTIPDYRVYAPEDTAIVFEERITGAPRAIKEWFFAGNNYGHEFVYPSTEGLELAKAEEPQAEKPAASAEVMHSEPPAAVEQPKESEMTPSPQEPEQQAEVQEQTAPEATMAKELPKTASLLPLMGSVGLLFLAGALGLRFACRQAD